MLFVHAADLHLGCAEPAVSRQARRHAFEALIQLCLRKNPDALLLAGDIFDSPHPAREEADYFFAQVQRLPNPVVIVAGNHDPHLPGSIWDDPRVDSGNLVLLSKDGEYVEFDGFRVYGASFSTHVCTDSLLHPLHAVRWDGINLLLLHGDTSSASSLSNPIPVPALALDPYAYIALGHIHKPMEPRLAGENVWSYAGTIAGHGFDEAGQHGCILAECVPGRPAQAHFFPLTESWFETVEINVNGLSSADEIRDCILQHLFEQYPETLSSMFIRARLTGRVPSSVQENISSLEEKLRETCALLEIEDKTRPLFNLDALRRERTLRGAFIREMEKEDPLDEQALLLGLEAFEEP